MTRLLITILTVALLNISDATAQEHAKGKCTNDITWTYDGQTLTLTNVSDPLLLADIPDYNAEGDVAPWVKRGLRIKKIRIGRHIRRIGTFAFANCTLLEDVELEIEHNLRQIGMGAFLNCTSLFSFPFTSSLTKIEKIAFANCQSLRSLKLQGSTKVEDYAFLSCSNISQLDLSTGVLLGKMVFARETTVGGVKKYDYFNGMIRNLPTTVTPSNSKAYGIDDNTVRMFIARKDKQTEEDTETQPTSSVDINLPEANMSRPNYYALIIGNEDYRFAPNVPFAKRDAQVFAEYCEKTLGIPSRNIHMLENATKHMLLEQELTDWLQSISTREQKQLIVYYAGHGVPDMEDNNKSYILPVDVYSTKPRYGIALDEFYDKLGELGFADVTVFIDACFSGVDRNHASVNSGERGTEVEAEDSRPTKGNMVVFCAAQGNETAQGYYERGHGLFTYYLLKELKQSKGSISYSKLAESINRNVRDTAPTLDLKKGQTPTVKTSGKSLKDRYF